MLTVKTKNEFDSILTKNTYVVVDFYADWCGPCKVIGPFVESLSRQEIYKNIVFCKVNIQGGEGPDIADLCDITSLPTFLFYKNGANTDELIGADKIELEKQLVKLLK